MNYAEEDTEVTETATTTETKKSAYNIRLDRLASQGKLKEYKKNQALRSVVYRACLTPEGKKNYNDKCSQRMREYRKRLKNIGKKQKVLTRAERERLEQKKEDRREYNKIKQREHRERILKKLRDASTNTEPVEQQESEEHVGQGHKRKMESADFEGKNKRLKFKIKINMKNSEAVDRANSPQTVENSTEPEVQAGELGPGLVAPGQPVVHQNPEEHSTGIVKQIISEL